jgi:hypothetical protein
VRLELESESVQLTSMAESGRVISVLELELEFGTVIGTDPGEILFTIVCRSSILHFSAANIVSVSNTPNEGPLQYCIDIFEN